MKLAALVALGAAAGGVLRYLIATYVVKHSGVEFPVSTLLINISGSFILGTLVGLSLGGRTTPATRALFATGFCGGYTTFSTFSVETVAMMEAGFALRAGIYVLASVVCSVLAAFGGMQLTRNA